MVLRTGMEGYRPRERALRAGNGLLRFAQQTEKPAELSALLTPCHGVEPAQQSSKTDGGYLVPEPAPAGVGLGDLSGRRPRSCRSLKQVSDSETRRRVAGKLEVASWKLEVFILPRRSSKWTHFVRRRAPPFSPSARSVYLLSPQRLWPRSMPPAPRAGSGSFCHGTRGSARPASGAASPRRYEYAAHFVGSKRAEA